MVRDIIVILEISNYRLSYIEIDYTKCTFFFQRTFVMTVVTMYEIYTAKFWLDGSVVIVIIVN